jgi:2-phosphosulfolactate phosphatase
VLLAGEREGLRIEGNLSNDVQFDFGNSPLEFLERPLTGRTIVMTTTNGTRALRACTTAQRTLVASFLNLDRTVEALAKNPPPRLLVVCSGTFEEAAYEDTLAAGALCDRLWQYYDGRASDSALMSRKLFLQESSRIEQGLQEARNGRRLLTRPALAGDVAFCARFNVFPLVAEMDSTGNITLKP